MSDDKDKRVYEVARQYNVSSEALLHVLGELDYKIKSPMSTMTEEMLEAVEERFQREKEAARREYELKKRRLEDRKQKEIKDKTRKRRKRRKKKERIDAKRKDTDDKKKKRRPRFESKVDQEAVKESVKKTLATMEFGRKTRRKRRKHTEETVEIVDESSKREVRVSEYISVSELAEQMNLQPTDVISKCLEMGLLVTINQRLDMETIQMVADEFAYEVKKLDEFALDELEEEKEVEMRHRPPVVTIMGHVDHGKTSLLDYIRRSNIIAGEAGGITQHIGAYEVELPRGKITFLDTPGHEAFTAMRARGAQVTDIVILVIAADENVKPQTIEAIDHARAAGVPIVVAINKIDLPGANPKAIKQKLSELGIMVEEWGGKVVAVETSAKTGEGVDKLLEMILLEAEMLELEANYMGRAKGVVVESWLDRGRGSMATVLVQSGILRPGDPFVTGSYSGRVRAMFNERGMAIDEAGPSTPVQLLGLSGIPQAGDSFHAVESEHRAKEIESKRQRLRREESFRQVRRVTLDDLYHQIKAGKVEELRIIIKGDVDGSVEALSDTLERLSTEMVKVKVIHRGVGAITESDVLLAAASDAVIIGFHVLPDPRAREVAIKERVDIRHYKVIYEAEDNVRASLEGLLEPEVKESVLGDVEVRETFKITRVGTVAGCYVCQGLVRRNSRVRVIRDGVIIYEGNISSLKRFKEDVREVNTGFECGVSVEDFNDIRVGDRLETYELEKIARKL